MVAKHRSGVEVLSGWDVSLSPHEVVLAPGQQVTVQVAVTPPGGFVGAQPFNLNAFSAGAFAGGVTLLVTKS
jgi:hypothetical protein